MAGEILFDMRWNFLFIYNTILLILDTFFKQLWISWNILNLLFLLNAVIDLFLKNFELLKKKSKFKKFTAGLMRLSVRHKNI